MLSILVLVGRILFVAVFLTSGVAHFAKTTMMASGARSKGIPLPWLATVVGGILLLAGGISVLFGIWADLGALLLAVFLLPTALLMHGFWREQAEARMMEQIQFFKDVGLGGAALMLVALFSYAGDALGYTITGPLFHLS